MPSPIVCPFQAPHHSQVQPPPPRSPPWGAALSLPAQPEADPRSQPSIPPEPPSQPPAPSSPPACPTWLGSVGTKGGRPTPRLRPPQPASFPSLFVDEMRLSAAARQSLRAGCPGPLCVELQEYGQARAHLRRYAQGNVTVWLGTEYTTYGLYGVIPQVGHRQAPVLAPAPLSPAVGNVGPARLGDGPVPPRCGGAGCAAAVPRA